MADLDLTEATRLVVAASGHIVGSLNHDLAVEAVVAEVERQVRDRIAADIEAASRQLGWGEDAAAADFAYQRAARIARGESRATPLPDEVT
jgi:hypothetical protein